MAIFEISQIQLPAFHFKIGVVLFLSINALQIHSRNRQNSTIFLVYFFPMFPFIPTMEIRKIFQGLQKGHIEKKSGNKDIKRKIPKFPFGFLHEETKVNFVVIFSGGQCQKGPLSVFPCNFYKLRNQPPKFSDFQF